MIRTINLVILLVTIGLAANAQSLQRWTWDYYKTEFKAPNNMVVRKSDATVYEASNNSVTMNIYPLTGQNLTHDGMKNAVIKWAEKSGLSYNSDNSKDAKQPIYLENINGYWGCAIDGTKSGFPHQLCCW